MKNGFLLRCCACLLVLVLSIPSTNGLTQVLRTWKKELQIGFKSRVEADPAFLQKSAVEVVLAASTHISAEYSRRGANFFPEIDFVVAGVLTALTGKYYTMWRVAKTKTEDSDDKSKKQEDNKFLGVSVPSNAFQNKMLDGVTQPTLQQRLYAIIAPMSPLAKAGFFQSLLGYGVTAMLIWIRSVLVPNYISVTKSVNILYAALFNGLYMATSSNLRYQIMQGVVEPPVDAIIKIPIINKMVIFMIRLGNSLLGSYLCILGMQYLGLQKQK